MTHATEKTAQPTCPTQQMSFGDAVRYLQGGFDEPVQRAIAAHVQYCNACQKQLEHFKALRRTGGQLLSAPLIDQAQSSDQLTDATLAAYLDGALPEGEHDQVTRQIASNYDNYLRFSALKAELAKPTDPGFSPPVAAIERAKVAIPETVHTEWRTPVEVVLQRAAQSLQTLLALKWPAPAMAFAVGAVLMMVLSPGAQTIVAVPGLTPPGVQTESAHIRSGLDSGSDNEIPVDMVIPVRKRQKLTFTWKPVVSPQVDVYRVLVTGPDGSSAVEQIATSDTKADVASDELKADNVYTLSVMGALENGGLMPVARYTFKIEQQ
ncbi:MAG: hypothetical protein R2832_12630 [Rhodothermales bacterium]